MKPDRHIPRNPLMRGGTAQSDREIKALSDTYFVPDERDLGDMILFGQRFSQHLKFYDGNNIEAGDWSRFFESDQTACFAALSKLPVDEYRRFSRDLMAWLKDDPKRLGADLRQHGRLLFNLPFMLLAELDRKIAPVLFTHAFGKSLLRLLDQEVIQSASQMIAWYKGGGPMLKAGDDLLAKNFNVSRNPSDKRIFVPASVHQAFFKSGDLMTAPIQNIMLARKEGRVWEDFVGDAGNDTSPFVDAPSNRAYDRLYDLVEYNLFDRSMSRIWTAFDRVRTEAEKELKKSLSEFGAHPAQSALWLAFLQIFKNVQGEMNTFTARHFDFYFKEVLGLHARSAVPSNAHVVFELAKNTPKNLIESGTLFKAGKDKNGKAAFAETLDDIVINKGKVGAQMALRMPDLTSRHSSPPKASPILASSDGLGAELPKDQHGYPSFGPQNAPAAQIGFAVADRKLFLREGERKIQFRTKLKGRIPSAETDFAWKVQLTSEEGWLDLETGEQVECKIHRIGDLNERLRDESRKPNRVRRRTNRRGRNRGKAEIQNIRTRYRNHKRFRRAYILRNIRKVLFRRQWVMDLNISLSPDDPAIIPYSQDLHGPDYKTNLPIAEVRFDFDKDEGAKSYAALSQMQTEDLNLSVTAKNLTNLYGRGGGSVLDLTKDFYPFGANPKAKDLLEIGSSEIFSKPIANLSFKFDWKNNYSETGFFRKRPAEFFRVSAQVLSAGAWKPIISSGDIGVGQKDKEITFDIHRKSRGRAAQSLENPTLAPASQDGFMRFKLQRSFGHSWFQRSHGLAMIKIANDQTPPKSSWYNYTSQRIPLDPYDPELSGISASYESTQDTVENLFHLHPFGHKKSKPNKLFPSHDFSAALYIGIEEFEGPARINLLMQIANGTGNPLLQMPPLLIDYLDGDDWYPLEDQAIADASYGMSTSGIMGLTLKQRESADHWIMPNGYYWLRISVRDRETAIPRLLDIQAQAARVRIVNEGIDPSYIGASLPAGTVSKLKNPIPQVKKVTQPFDSFGGKPAEARAPFKRRLTERLRHKDRAITPWDFEALILEEFPNLQRVKCLNTTRTTRDMDGKIISENDLMPGSVIVLPLIKTEGHNSLDPLHPYCDQATLGAIDRFLRKRISPFVNLEVQNPKFEAIHVATRVQFQDQIADIPFYKDKLNEALINFLSPWANGSNVDVRFGGKIWKSSIIDFLDRQESVDFVEDVKLFHRTDIYSNSRGWRRTEFEVIAPSTDRAILVSDTNHSIQEVKKQ